MDKGSAAESVRTAIGNDLLLYEKAQNLCSNSGIAAAVNISVASLLLFSLPEPRLDWFWAILVASLFRFGLFFWSKGKSADRQAPGLRYKVALASIALQGAAWGAASVVLYSSLTAAQRFFLITVLVGLTAGSLLTLSPSFAAFFSFVAPATIPLLLIIISEADDIFRYIGFMGIVYVFAINVVARKIYLSAIEQLATRQRLERANRQLRTYQDALEEIVAKRTKNLQTSEERYRDSFEMAVVGMAVLGLDGRFVRTNPAFQKMLGYSEEELSRKTFSTVTSPEGRALLKDQLQNALDGAADVILEASLLKKSGEIAEVIASFRVVNDDGGKPLHFIVQILDITDRRRIEREQLVLNEKLRQSQKMEAIGTLAGGIAHDFNNILAAIIGYAELSKLKLADRPKEKSFQEEILKAGKRGKQLVQQILVFSRKGEEKRERIKVALVVEEALSLIRHTIPATIPIHVFLNPLTGAIQGDPLHIHQVVINLCTNAYHAVRDGGGEIDVRLEPVEIDQQMCRQNTDLTPGAYARLTIKDTGSGIPAVIKSRIFEPFFTTKTQGEGTGMGLAIVYGIIQNHGGFIDVESEADVGSTFRIFLPLLPEEPDRVADILDDLPRGNERVLFVDDESMLADLGRMLLETLGYKATATTSAAEAVELFRRNPDGYDLIITDQAMPEMSGAQLAKEMMHIRADIPIILCTGFSESMNADLARELGIKAFTLKPIEQGTLARTIREVLDDHSP